jgi:hypothetical protein
MWWRSTTGWFGARVASQAQAGEVLVSSTVKDLVAGSGIEFEDRGDVMLKGPRPVAVVRSEGRADAVRVPQRLHQNIRRDAGLAGVGLCGIDRRRKPLEVVMARR